MINRQRGVALLMVLFILALMMILASAMTERTAVMYQHTAVTLDNLQARWYALAAENMAAALLQRDALDSPSQTNLAQTWAQEGRRFTLDDGEIRATIRDGHACFNLNAIDHRADEAGDGTPYPTDVFVRLLALLGEPPLRASQIAAALGDWTDSDGQPRLNGAEDEVYMAQTPGYLAANQPMQDVSELRLLAGMDAALYQRLLPFVCVQPDDALQVNVNTLRPSQAALLVALFSRRSDAAGGATAAAQPPANRVEQRRRLSRAADAAENRYHACPSLADGAQRTLYRRFYRGDWQSPLSAAQRPATAGAHVHRRPAAIWTLYGGR
ncbi:pullulanase [Klebsiella pneumoniae subsp. rhinoscleromatis]|nr:pullulanase [Klebsiella pneumoniae subsp. rhinoscleromatis]